MSDLDKSGSINYEEFIRAFEKDNSKVLRRWVVFKHSGLGLPETSV